jgi:serine/threonine protein kinase
MEPSVAPVVWAGRYELGVVIGRGGMGDVFGGQDLRLGRAVAIKVLRADMAADPESRRRFEVEARAAARLLHPHAVAVYDTGEEDGVPFIVMERLPGATLADEIAGAPLDPERACRLTLQILSALEAAHRQGIVHRDVKPGNVLLTEHGDAKLADFGIAKVAERHDATMTVGLIGTPAYLSPDRLAGRPATPADDVYAVGVLLYETLTAAKPFVGDTPFAVMHAIQTGRVRPLEDLRADVDPSLVALIGRAMATDRRRRFRSAADMAAALGATNPGVIPAVSAATAEALDATVADLPAATAIWHDPAAHLYDGTKAGRRAGRDRSASRWSRAHARITVAVGVVLVVASLVAFNANRDNELAELLRTPPPSTTAVPAQQSAPTTLQVAIDELRKSVQP